MTDCLGKTHKPCNIKTFIITERYNITGLIAYSLFHPHNTLLTQLKLTYDRYDILDIVDKHCNEKLFLLNNKITNILFNHFN